MSHTPSMSLLCQVLLVLCAMAATMVTRFLPFLLFRPGRATPRTVTFLGRVLPAAVFAMLVIYCLRSVDFSRLPVPGFWRSDAFAQLVSVLVTALIHAWRRNMMWSIAAGTLGYMTLIRVL